jgi:hypothetical protein
MLLRRDLGDGPLELHLWERSEFLDALIRLADNPAPENFQLMQQAAKAITTVGERHEHGELYCYLCDKPIARDLPPIVGLLRPEDRPLEAIAAFALCEPCRHEHADDREGLIEAISAACGTSRAPAPTVN